MGSVAGLSNLFHQKIYAQEDAGPDTSGGDAGIPDTSNSDTSILDTGGASLGCYTFREACSASDLLLNDDNNVLCDPSDGTDCTQFLSPPQVAPTDQGDTGAPLPEFDWLTQGNPDAPVIQSTDPPGQYCNPRVETCDAATLNQGGCFTDIITHGSVCDYTQKPEDGSSTSFGPGTETLPGETLTETLPETLPGELPDSSIAEGIVPTGKCNIVVPTAACFPKVKPSEPPGPDHPKCNIGTNPGACDDTCDPNSPTLFFGSPLKSKVQELQLDLMKLRYSVGPHKDDGIYGPDTQAGVINFQIDHKLKLADGIVGPETWGAICSDMATKR